LLSVLFETGPDARQFTSQTAIHGHGSVFDEWPAFGQHV
jgi:hypothetical protein